MLSRFKFIGIHLLFGAVLALIVAGPMMPTEMDFRGRSFVWISVMSGPVVGTEWGINDFRTPIVLGWLGLLLIPVHSLRPNVIMGCVSSLGFLLWFIIGFLTMMEAVWGG